MLKCPNCQAEIAYHLVEKGLVQPTTGDMGVCFSCGERMIFGTEGQFVGLTDEMVREMPLEWQENLRRHWTLWNEKYSIRGS